MTLEVFRRPLTVYRLAQRNDGRSMWYDRSAEFDPLDEVFSNIPMPLDGRALLHQQVGGEWLSSTEDPDMLRLWFPGMGAMLHKMGFLAHKVRVQEYVRLPNEIVFNRDTAVVETLGMDLESLLDTPQAV